MKLKELIKKYEAVECVVGIVSGKTILKTVLRDLKQLDEPEKVKVPQFVADWIEESKKSCETVTDFFRYKFSNIEMIKYLKKKERINLVARAWLDGYEVEEEKRYEVILCNGQSLKTVYRQGDDHLDFEMVYGDLESFTRKRLEEADFGWVFDCPGIEIEDVE